MSEPRMCSSTTSRTRCLWLLKPVVAVGGSRKRTSVPGFAVSEVCPTHSVQHCIPLLQISRRFELVAAYCTSVPAIA
eukprot:986607-Rhodomonas_salina.2